MLDDFVDKLRTYDYYRTLIINDKAHGRRILIETKDGEFKVVPDIWLSDVYQDRFEEIERITLFFKVKPKRGSREKVQWREYEFVATAG